MGVKEYLWVIGKRWLFILIITLGATLASAILSYFIISPTYKSDISVIIEKLGTSAGASNQEMSYNDVVMYQMLVKTYSELAKSRSVAENTIKSLKLNISPEEFEKMITITPNSGTQFLTITVRSKDPMQAMVIANQLAKSLKEVSITVKNMDNVQILDPAQLPTAPDSPKPMINMTIAFLIGLIVSMGLAFLIEYLDNTIKTPEDIERLIGIPVMGMIPTDEIK